MLQTIKTSFRKKPTYGPVDPDLREEWKQFRQAAKSDRELIRKNWFHHIGLSLYGGYRMGKAR